MAARMTLQRTQTHTVQMFVPIYLSSDKTTVSVATGQNNFHPVYISVGNIHNGIRHADGGGFMLLAFLPILRGEYSMDFEMFTLALKVWLRQPKGWNQSSLQKIPVAVVPWIPLENTELHPEAHEEVQYCSLC